MTDSKKEYQDWKHGKLMLHDEKKYQRFMRKSIAEKDLFPGERERQLADFDSWTEDWK